MTIGAMKFLHMSPIAVSLIGILYARNLGQISAMPLAPAAGNMLRWEGLLHMLLATAMENRTIRMPVKCPCCGQESLMVSSLDTIVDRLATERHLKLSSECAYHRVTWVANEIERNQIREYAAALQFAMCEQLQRPRRFA